MLGYIICYLLINMTSFEIIIEINQIIRIILLKLLQMPFELVNYLQFR